jgi:hypothetical protein
MINILRRRDLGGKPAPTEHSYIVSSSLYNGPGLRQRVHKEED